MAFIHVWLLLTESWTAANTSNALASYIGYPKSSGLAGLLALSPHGFFEALGVLAAGNSILNSEPLPT